MIEMLVLIVGVMPLFVGLYAIKLIRRSDDEGSGDPPPPPQPEPPLPLLPPSLEPRRPHRPQSRRDDRTPVACTPLRSTSWPRVPRC